MVHVAVDNDFILCVEDYTKGGFEIHTFMSPPGIEF